MVCSPLYIVMINIIIHSRQGHKSETIELHNINDNDILVYLDADCTIDPKGEKGFQEYVVTLNKGHDGVISF